jgi:SNF2 family DNA or RNA helicase
MFLKRSILSQISGNYRFYKAFLQGKEHYLDKSSIELDQEKREISATVNSYEVTIKFEDDQIISHRCDCEKQYCVHLGTLSRYLHDVSESGFQNTLKQNYIKTLHADTTTKFFRPGMQNYLYLNAKEKFIEYFKEFQPNFDLIQDRYFKMRNAKLHPEGLFSFVISNCLYSEPLDMFDVSFRKDADGICFKIDKLYNIKDLTEKEVRFSVLGTEGMLDFIYDFPWYDIEALYRRIAEENSITIQSLKKNYELKVMDNFIIVPNRTNEKYINAMDLKNMENEIIRSRAQFEDLVFQQLKEEKSKQDHYLNAIAWHGINKMKGIELLQGKSTKTKDKLSSHIEKADFPYFYNEEEEQLYYTINQRFQYEDNESIYLISDLLIRDLKNHISLLQKTIHYAVYHRYDTEIRKSDLNKFEFKTDFANIIIKVKETKEEYVLEFYFKINRALIPFSNLTSYEIFPAFILLDEKAYVYESPRGYLIWNKIQSVQIIDKDKTSLFKTLSFFQAHCEIEHLASTAPEHKIYQNPDKEIYLTEQEDYIVLQAFCKYMDEIDINVLTSERTGIMPLEDDFVQYEIEESDIREFCDFIIQSHPALKESQESYNMFVIHKDDFIKDAWFLDFHERCKNQNITVYGQENISGFRYNTHKAKINIAVTSGIDWFDVTVDMSFGEQKASLKHWVESIRNKKKYVQLEDGSFGIIPEEWLEKLKAITQATEISKDEIKLNKFKFGLVDGLFDQHLDEELREKLRDKVNRLTQLELNENYPLPKKLKAELRPYQLQGFQWLKTLDEMEMGACLADDMGLGKTIQILTLLLDQKWNKKGTSMVIVPRSLLFNWSAEIEKFCPDLKYMIYHGAQRSVDNKQLKSLDIVITTYDTTTSDIEKLKDIKFNYIVLDESQAIKNPNSLRYKAVRLLAARNRIVATGTPIENNTFDLFAQFSFINPGIFGSAHNFSKEFATPVDRDKDTDTLNLLQKIIRPFILRRTKEFVAADLPEKQENVIYCEMDTQQRSYYDAMKNKIRDELVNDIEGKGFAKSKLKVIEGLLRLRQICNSPRLIDPQIKGNKSISVKLDTLTEIIETELNNNNALIFSQFTSMLALLREILDKKKIKYAYLDGSTTNRQAAVEYFDKNEDVKIFLISLKAGNTGLNLVKADYVYIIDPWWNPAVEAQAIDRTHRIGQDKRVFAYKMVCKDSIEEKILELQKNKKKLSSDLISVDENIFKSLDKNDILNLLV